VAEFLQSKGIRAERLKTEGKGFNELLLRDQPEAPENRRVRIVAVE
jgi:outer membrane protein OmpA-like peptidoglycan-associated protein